MVYHSRGVIHPLFRNLEVLLIELAFPLVMQLSASQSLSSSSAADFLALQNPRSTLGDEAAAAARVSGSVQNGREGE